MGYEFRNKARVRTNQNLIDIAVQEYGRPDALFTIIDLNPTQNFTIDSVLDSLVTDQIFADNQTDQDIDLVKKFDLERRNVVNEDFIVLVPPVDMGGYSSGYSSGFNIG